MTVFTECYVPTHLEQELSQLDDFESRDQLEIADIRSSNAVAEFQSARSDQQIRERNTQTPRLTLAVDVAGAERSEP